MRDKDQILLEHIVTEVIVEPYEYEWTQQTQKWWNGYFKTENDTGIKVSITNHWGANHWEIIFSTDIEDKSDRDLAYIRQDTGNPFKVFKTVHIMLDEFLQNKKSKKKQEELVSNLPNATVPAGRIRCVFACLSCEVNNCFCVASVFSSMMWQ